MIIGGVAASILGRPRLTQDVEALVLLPDDKWQGLHHRASGVDLDITLGGLQFERTAIAMSVQHNVGGLLVRLPRIEDLLVMKAVARRPKDMEDMRNLLSAHPDFAAATGMSDMLVEYDLLIESVDFGK
jgi:hypothetical protein